MSRTLYDTEPSDKEDEMFEWVEAFVPLVVYACEECETQIRRWYGGLRITDECPQCFDGVYSENDSLTSFRVVQLGHFDPKGGSD